LIYYVLGNAVVNHIILNWILLPQSFKVKNSYVYDHGLETQVFTKMVGNKYFIPN